MLITRFLLICLLAYCHITFSATATPEPLSVEAFIDKMVVVHHYDRNKLIDLFQHTEYIPEVIERISKPFEEKPWDFYKGFFITKDRIQGGVNYWHEHADTISKAAKDYGVSPAVIVAIIGIETRYGLETGKYPALGTLATLSFRYPKRALFFQSQLEHYLLLTEQFQLPPLEINGSYAGALGIPQFMPSNYRQYAVNYDGQKQVNLLENHDDAIASIAYYLQRSGWKPNQPVAVPATIAGNKVRSWLISTDTKPIYQLRKLEEFGVKPAAELSPPSRKAALIVMHNAHGEEYWLTFQNFYAIMAYNPRTTYAMAIYQLSEAIEKAYAQ